MTISYGSNGRISSIADPAGGIYGYDYFLLTWVDWVYHYDLDGHLIAETGQDGELQRAYVWLDDMPLAQIDGKGKNKDPDKNNKIKPAKESLAWLHTDHLGTPRMATDASGQVVWRWDSDAFGAKTPEGRVGNDGKLTVNLRFPGQYFDGETGLHYNWNRYYDPGTLILIAIPW